MCLNPKLSSKLGENLDQTPEPIKISLGSTALVPGILLTVVIVIIFAVGSANTGTGTLPTDFAGYFIIFGSLC